MLSIRPDLVAHPSGALWLPEARTAVIADLHLGYSWAQRRRGELGPLVDERTREKLLTLRNELQPLRFVFLGDIVHAPRPCSPERDWIESTLSDLSSKAQLTAVRGNHDRRFASDFGHLGFETLDTWNYSHYTMAHGDRWTFAWPENHTIVLGHLHPALAVRDASGAGHKLPVFLVGSRCIVLPAFSPFARGYDVALGLPSELQRCYCDQPPETYAVTGKRVVRLGCLQTAINTAAETDTSSAAHFRRRNAARRSSNA